MEVQLKRRWGMTDPISDAPPTDADIELNSQLIEELKRQNNFETAEGSENRNKVLTHFQKVTEEFVRRVLKAKGKPQSTIDNAGGRIFPFGSFALGVYGPGSDIDTLVVAPNHVDQNDFFKFFPTTLREMSSAEQITKLEDVPDAYVPIIKIEFAGVDIDLIFVSIPSKSSIGPDFNVSDKSVLRGLEDGSMRSINGTRVTKELLDAVPQVKVFRHATRAIKLWANRRGVYGAVFGYPGGVAWAIMVARICQLYPYATGGTILSKFFTLLMKWPWPRPVMLKGIEEGALGLKVWNPQIYHGDRAHMMPVITPAFPSMCATHTITPSTKQTMLQEFQHADNIISGILAKQKTWKDLFTPHTFFTKDHKYYLSVIAASREQKLHAKWEGWIQSRVRTLAKGIDDSEAGVSVARPFPKAYSRIHHCQTEDEVEKVVQGDMKFVFKKGENEIREYEAKTADVEVPAAPHVIYTTTWYIGITLQEGGARQLDISYPVQEFKRMVTDRERFSYDEDLHSIRIIHTRNFDLPDDVFEPGETRPTKPIKTKTKKAKSQPQQNPQPVSTATKRGVAEAGLDDPSAKRQRQHANGVAASA